MARVQLPVASVDKTMLHDRLFLTFYSTLCCHNIIIVAQIR